MPVSTTIWNTPEFKPHKAAWFARQRELGRRAAYYDGSIFTKKHQILGLTLPGIYRGIKSLYLPFSRAVDVDCGIIPGEWALDEDAPERVEDAIKAVFNQSGWGMRGVLYVHYGAMLGVSGLKVSDQRDEGKVIIAPIDPRRYMLVPGEVYSTEPMMAIVVERHNGFEYAEVITRDVIRTFKDGEPFGYAGREPEYPNELEAIPIFEVSHIETGEELGETTYSKAIPLLNELNELASYLADIIKKHAEPQWAIFGTEATDLEKSGDNVWFMPQGSDAKALVAQVDAGGVLSFIQEVRDQVRGSLPELAFDDLKDKSQIATATLELQLMELVLKVKRSRPNYDHGLHQALRLAGQAGSSMGLSDLTPLADEDWSFDNERNVLPLSKLQQIEVELAELDLDAKRKSQSTPQPIISQAPEQGQSPTSDQAPNPPTP
jgi:hypothetical protein